MDVAVRLITNHNFIKAVNRLGEAANYMRNDLICILNQVEEIYNCQYLECFDAIALKSAIRDVANGAFRYADSVKDLYYFCNQSNFLEIKENLINNNNDLLFQFVQRKSFYIEEAKSHHSSFCACLDNVRMELTTAANEVVKNQSKAKLRKNASRAVGGSATAAVITAGTTISVAAGYFTFGIGTAIGLPITAVAGVTAGVVTHFVAEDFYKTEKALRTYADKFASLNNIAEKIKEPVDALSRGTVTFERQHRSLQLMEHHDNHTICCTLDMLYEISTQQYPIIVQLVKDIQRFKDEVC